MVFQALNVETGDFVAMKRFPLSTVDEESLASIQVSGAWMNAWDFFALLDAVCVTTRTWVCRVKLS